MKQKYDIIVVGAGASGMVAAIAAARTGATVCILEHMDSAGRKILATGNGKCNYTNRLQGVEYYHGDNPAFVLPIFEQFGWQETVAFFEELGIMPKEKNGYYYPASEQASSVLAVLLMELERLAVPVVYSCGIRAITKTGCGDEKVFLFDTKDGVFESRRCVMATGGKAAKKTGSDGSGFLYLEKLGHHIIDVVPALVQLQGKQSFFKEIAGIRAEISIKLYSKNRLVSTEIGELQLTDFGISGIPVFQLSRWAAKGLQKGEEVYTLLDFMPELTEVELLELLKQRFGALGMAYSSQKTATQALIGFCQSKLIPVFLRLSGIKETIMANQVTDKQLRQLSQTIKHFRVDITGTKKFDFAQTTAGGVDTSEIDGETLASQLVPGMYFAGEMIDIDGKCGGYNLQWAWSSGYVSGQHAALSLKQ